MDKFNSRKAFDLRGRPKLRLPYFVQLPGVASVLKEAKLVMGHKKMGL